MEPQKFHELILVLDFGGQYNQLIARRVREAGVYCEMLPYTISIEEIQKKNPKGIIFSGGPSSVYSEGAPRIDKRIYSLGIPILGICYGMQLMAFELGGKVEKSTAHEYGKSSFTKVDNNNMFFNKIENYQCWMSHGDYIKEPPEGFSVTASTENAPAAAISDEKRQLYGVQFHPEVNHTVQGQDMLKNFLFDICNCKGEWTMESYIEEQVKIIRETVGDSKVICALSGGVDSAVTAALVHKAIGKQLTSVFVDTGLMRQGEPEQVKETFEKQFKMNLITVDAEERFLRRLKDVKDPEEKRKIIGEEFIRVFEEESNKIKNAKFLAQGTIYPDIIESGTDTANTIKSHHNVGGLPEKMDLDLVEPLRPLFKDEVRKLGTELGLPDEIVMRQPFPGPGLAIRILGEVTKDKLEIVRKANHILMEIIHNEGLYNEIWQCFAVLPTMKSVGVKGDVRSYDYPIIVRAVTSKDAMTADWARIPYDVLEKISNNIINNVSQINRVVYDITSKPPGTIEWE